jgi:predicted alpha/beta superfamily hydrolase
MGNDDSRKFEVIRNYPHGFRLFHVVCKTCSMTSKLPALVFAFIAISCAPTERQQQPPASPLTEFSNYYADPLSEMMYSSNVEDSFKLFISTPGDYSPDSTEKYPLIILLDGNAFLESTVAELKFNSFIGLIPKCIVVGVGYKNFMAMDSLRSRDYTWPTAIPEYEMTLSGGADKFKKFIDDELMPRMITSYRIDINRSVICGHSLGGYFTLFYGLKSMEENRFSIKNMVSASPSLHYNHRFLFAMEKNLAKPGGAVPLNFYVSMGSEDMNDEESKGILDAFEKQIKDSNYKSFRFRKAEYSNFGHIDAAVPGFIKGLTYVFQE